MPIFSAQVSSGSLVRFCGMTPMPARTALGSRMISCPATTALAPGGRHQRRQHADERAFASAVRSEQAEDLAALDHEADVIHRQQRAKALADTFDVDRDAVGGLALRFHGG